MPNETTNNQQETESVKLVRGRLDLQVNSQVIFDNQVYQITEICDFEMAIGVNVETGRTKPLAINALSMVEPSLFNHLEHDIHNYSDEEWLEAQHRFRVIKPLIKIHGGGRKNVEQRSKEMGVSVATIYRWIKKYKDYGNTASLVSRPRGWAAGHTRLPPDTESVIQEVIKDYYLTVKRPLIQNTIREIQRRCFLRNIRKPSGTAIRARIHEISDKHRLYQRGQKEEAKNKYRPAPGKFPFQDYPLEAVQIDHTPLDLILVDDINREPIGRPNLSLAMDIHSRMITGYYLSLDKPSAASVGLCLAHSIIPKDEWLVLQEVDADWPVWGVPDTIYIDNGPDFRSDTLRKSCEMHGINIEYRPIKTPHYGGHIERVLGTINKELHTLPGATFSSIQKRGEVDPEKMASLTFSEFEKWLVTFICNVYHLETHSELGMAPIRRWELSIFGDDETTGAGIPSRPADRTSLYIDFLPSFDRTVQAFGVTIDGLVYYADVLRKWINAKEPSDRKAKRRFVFRRDPRDLSMLWFKDPDVSEYYKIHLADVTIPAFSLWEYRAAKDKLKLEGRDHCNEAQIFRAMTDMREIENESVVKTKKAKINRQKRINHRKKTSPATPLEKQAKVQIENPASFVEEFVIDLEGLGGIE